MLESGNTEALSADTDCVLNDELAYPSMMVNQLMHNLVQVEGNESGTTSAGEVIEVNHLLSESQTEKLLDDGSMYLNSESTEKCPAVDSQTCTSEYKHQEIDHCILDSDTAQIERPESNYEFVDSILRDVDKERNLHLQFTLSSLCHDYLSDSAYDEIFMLGDHSPTKLKRSDSKFQSQSIQKDGNAAGVSDLSSGINPMTKSSSSQNSAVLDKMDVCELQRAFSSIFGRDTCVTDIPWLKRRILFGMQNIGEVDNADNTLKIGLPSTKDEDNMILIPGNDLYERAYTFYRDAHDNRTLKVGEGLGNDGYPCKGYPKTTSKVSRVGFVLQILEEHGSAVTTSKRLRKPTRRYIDEISELESKCSKERLETPYVGYKAKYSYNGTNGRQGLLERNLVYQDNFAASHTQVQQGLTVWRGHSGKSTSVANYESKTQSHTSEEALDDTSDDSTIIRSKRKGTRRKHHKPWVLSEVVKLVDGVSQYGVGRWTKMKRLLFSNSVHRTPVDLKDKWRNLLRAAAQANNGKVKQHKKGGKHTVPLCILWRVRQLSIIHPYPRERESGLRSTKATSSTVSCKST